MIGGKRGPHGFKPVYVAAKRVAVFRYRLLEFAPLGLPGCVSSTVFDDVILERCVEIALADNEALGAVACAQTFNLEIAVLSDQFKGE